MNPITRFRVARLKMKLAKLLAEDSKARLGSTTRVMMDDMVARSGQIATLQYRIRVLEGTQDEPVAEDSDTPRFRESSQ